MKNIVFCFFLMLALHVCAQTADPTKTTAQKTPEMPAAAPQNLQDAFAIHALHVVGLIEAEADEPRMRQDGNMVYPGVLEDAMSGLYHEAQNKEERAVAEELLYPFYMAKMSHNSTILSLSYMAAAALLQANLPRGPRDVSAVVSKSPTVAAIHTKEEACSDALEAMLRSRSYQDIEACSKDSLAVPVPDKLDVPAN